MRVFVTGATGFIGSAVVPDLIAAGHDVVGLARSETKAAALAAAGAEALIGTIDDLDLLRDAASDADAVIHLAFKHDIAFSGDFPAAAAADRTAIDAIGEALRGTGKAFTIASGTLETAPGEVATEHDRPDLGEGSGAAVRLANAQAVLDLADQGVRASVVRVPIVHGENDPGFLTVLVEIARSRGVSGHVDDGSARWPAAHLADVAAVFRLAIEKAPAGSVLHAVDDEGVPFREIAAAVGAGLGIPTVSVPADEAIGHFGWLGAFAAVDRGASSDYTRELLGWKPNGPSLLADLEQGHYFVAR
jgi:nucleoside-diphosphate-sugar epimerase